MLALKEPEEINVSSGKVDIYLNNKTLKNTLMNDQALSKKLDKHSYVWVSGGGSYLANDQYLIVLKRSANAKFNPNKYSLFTGRSDNVRELLNPTLLTRELFEELILWNGKKLLYPQHPSIQKIITQTYRKLSRQLPSKSKILMPLKDIKLKTKKILIHNKNNKILQFRQNFHINKKNEINVLNLYAVNVDLDTLRAMDGEAHRDIFLMNLRNSTLKNISSEKQSKKPLKISSSQMTEHLQYLIKCLKERTA